MVVAGPTQSTNGPSLSNQQEVRGVDLNTSFGSEKKIDFRAAELLAQRGGPVTPVKKSDPFTDPIPVPVTVKDGVVTHLEHISAQEVMNRSSEMSIEARVMRVTNPNFVPGIDKQIDSYAATLPGRVTPAQNPADYKKVNDMVARIDPEGAKAGKYEVIIVSDPKVNAYAAGNKLVVTTGMLAATKDNDDALLGVTAHEIGHIRSGHSYLPKATSEPTATSSRQEVVDYLAKLHLRGTCELEADVYAGNRLRALGVSTEPVRRLLSDTFGKDDELIQETTHQYARYMPRDQAEVLNQITTPYPKVETREQQIAPGEPSVIPRKPE